MEGDNKYDAGEHGLQEAEKGVIFVSFPPILHLHLMRFQYDPITDNSVKFNDRFEFYEHIHLEDFLQQPATDDAPADYTLHAVLVHSGDNHGGHYVVYINPLGDGRWCKFDDDVVSRCTKSEAIEHNYGGADDDLSLNAKHCSNAYMLVYIRDSEMPTVLQEIRESEIPTELSERLLEERRMEQVRRRERSEANSYMAVHVLLEEYFEGHQTTDLFDTERTQFRIFKMKKTQTVAELVQVMCDAFRTRPEHMRLWPLGQRHNLITRPTFFDPKDSYKPLFNAAELQNPWTIFLEILSPDVVASAALAQQQMLMPPFDRNRDVLLFFKFYDPTLKRLNYCGLGYYKLHQHVSELVPDMCRRAGFPVGTELTMYEEQGANVVQRIQNHNETLEKILKVIRDMEVDVIIFEKKTPVIEASAAAAAVVSAAAATAVGSPAAGAAGGVAVVSGGGAVLPPQLQQPELPTCEDYFRDLLYRVEVTFIDKQQPADAGFTLELSQRMTYDQMASAVGERIGVDPYEIQFFKCQKLVLLLLLSIIFIHYFSFYIQL